MMIKVCVWFLVALHWFPTVHCWDSDDFELFDLVEEINKNFYDVLGIVQSTDGPDLKRAYRKLSLQLHPDRNKEPDATLKFRQLVAVFEVLKDAKKRAKYDEILANGLPDWRQPVFYYRRVRKMGLLELCLLLTVLLTVGHFITLWSIYLERRFVKEELFRSRKKRDKKARRGRQTDSAADSDEELEVELSGITRPKLSDLLPCLIVRQTVLLVCGLPAALKDAVNRVSEWRKQEESEVDELDSNTGIRERVVRKRPNLTPTVVETLPFESTGNRSHSSLDSLQDTTQQQTTTKISDGTEWSEAEIALLAKAVARYPGGVTDRWEKIASMVGRSVKEVSAMSRQLKSHYARSVDPSAQGITATALTDSATKVQIAPSDLTTRDDNIDSPVDTAVDQRVPQCTTSDNYCEQTDSSNESVLRHRHKPKVKSADRTLMIAQQIPTPGAVIPGATVDKSAWTQQQQKLLELALNQCSKGLADRWDRVADMVPGKTKDECIQRYKHLAELVKKKQQEKTQQTNTTTE